jgi:hypothetical protein
MASDGAPARAAAHTRPAPATNPVAFDGIALELSLDFDPAAPRLIDDLLSMGCTTYPLRI